VRAQGLLVLPAEATAAQKGEEVSVIPLDSYLFHTAEPNYLPKA
jgi:hypothetical protein